MNLKELLDFVSWENNRVRSKIIKDYSKREEIFFRTTKMTEELGELCNEVIALEGGHRQDKQIKFKKDNLSEEFADVILVTLLLGDTLDIDIESALRNKIAKVKKTEY